MARRVWIVLVIWLGACDQVFGLERTVEPDGDWTRVSAGYAQTCGIKVDGSLWCWGDNTKGKLGVAEPRVNTPIEFGGSWIDVSTGYLHTCGIRDDRSLWCWGENSYGQLGTGVAGPQPGLMPVGGRTWNRVVARGYHTCAIADDETLWCWGNNDHQQVGPGPSPVLVPLQHEGAWSGVVATGRLTCGLATDGGLWCWGAPAAGQTGDPDAPVDPMTLRLLPARAPGTWRSIALSDYSICAVSLEGHARCWGDNTFGQLGDGTTTFSLRGVAVGGDADDWESIVGGGAHFCGTRSSGDMFCWGDNSRGQIGSAEVGRIASLPAAIVVTDGPAIDVSLGATHTCVLDARRRLWCGGGNASGQLGQGLGNGLRPGKVEGAWESVHAVPGAPLEDFTCGRRADGVVACWGAPSYEQLGDNTGQARQEPTPIALADRVDDVIVGIRFGCVLREGEKLCWGFGANGVFGDDTVATRYRPTKIPDPTWPTTASFHACAIAAGELSCWGANMYGQTGQSAIVQNILHPVAVGTDKTWESVAAASRSTCAVNATGVFCWGDNLYHQLGSSMPQPFTNVPTQVANLSPSSRLFAGGYSACAIDGARSTCWGLNNSGQLGEIGPLGPVPPTEFPGAWRKFSIGAVHSCGIDAGGTLWCWGLNEHGQLGDGTQTTRQQPMPVGDATDWVDVVVGYDHTCARKSDRSLWCWGLNASGELGTNTAWTRDLRIVR